MAKIIFSFDMRVYFSCKGIKVVEMLVNILRDIVSYLISCYTVNDCTLCCGVAAAVPLKTDTKCITPKQSAIHKIIVEVDRLTVDCIVIFCIIDVCIKNYVNYLIYGIAITSLLLPYKRKNRFQHIFVCICLCSVSRLRLCKGIG